MAALCRIVGKATRSQPLFLKHIKSPCAQTFEANVGVAGVIFTRGKGKSTKRFKLPSVHQDRDHFMHAKTASLKNLTEEDPDVKHEGRVPEDDVWIRKYYPYPRYSLMEAVAMHREAAVPEMLDNEDGILVLNMTLDLRTKKKTKFMKEFTHTVVLPHFFDDGTVHRLLVFCKTPQDKTMASSLGAELVGGIELIKAMQKGEIKHDDFDHCICTPDIYAEISTLRKHLRERFPNPKAGSVGDIKAMFKIFTEGKTYESRAVEEKVGKLEAHFATLNMSDNQIIENFEKVIEEICSLKSANLGQFITKCTLECPPSRELFHIHEEELIPKTQRLGGKKNLVQEETPPKSEDDDDNIVVKAVAK